MFLWSYLNPHSSCFQVREAKAYLFDSIFACLATVSRFLDLCATVNVWNALLCYDWYVCNALFHDFGYVCMAGVGRTMARSDVFAQASLSRLGETSRKRPRFILELSF